MAKHLNIGEKMTSMGENDCYLSQLSFHWLMNFDKQISPSQMLSIHILLNQHNGQYYLYHLEIFYL